MNREAVLEQVRQVLDDELGVPSEKVIPSANLRDDLEMDSLDLVELVAVLEDRIGNAIQGHGVDDVRTVDDVVDVIMSVMAETQDPVTQ